MFSDPQGLEELIEAFLLGFPALFSVVNPVGGAFAFQALTPGCTEVERSRLAHRVALYSVAVLMVALWAGSFVLTFFGVSLAALRCAGGLVIAANAWKMLQAPDEETSSAPANPSHLAFFPLTMPVTAGPGSISVAVALSSEHPTLFGGLGWFFLGLSVAAVAVAACIWVIYGNAHRVTGLFGEGGNRIFTRLIGFLLLCIGIQILTTGVQQVFHLPTE